MKIKFLGLVLLALAITLPARAQGNLRVTAGPHSVSLSWSAVSGATTKVYRANCSAAIAGGVCPTASEGTFTVITSPALSAGTATYTDTNVTQNQNYSYYVTANCTPPACGNNSTGNPYSGESVASNHVGASVPADVVPPPPPSLSITTVASNESGNKQTVTASWRDSAQNTTFTLTNAKSKIFMNGSMYSGNGDFWFYWNGKAQPVPITISICDTASCVSRIVS